MANISFGGNVGGDPELRFLPQGDPVLGFSVAENHSRKDKQTGQWETTGTTWRRVSVWGQKAEALAESLRKGDRVLVVGREETQEYEKDGQTRSSLKVTADHVALVPSQNAPQGGYQPPGGTRGRSRDSSPSKGDPWGSQQPMSTDWGNDGNPPY